MARDVVAIHADDLIERAEQLMRGHQIHRLPVLDAEGHLASVLSLNDLARLAARARRSGVDRELVRTLATICQPRAQSVPPAQQAQQAVTRQAIAG